MKEKYRRVPILNPELSHMCAHLHNIKSTHATDARQTTAVHETEALSIPLKIELCNGVMLAPYRWMSENTYVFFFLFVLEYLAYPVLEFFL